jgi:hypothetical protein
MREPNLEKLNALVGKLVGDLGISLGGASILLGDRLGLYKAMADGAVITPSELAKKTGLHERYVREWLSGQAASGYIDYHPEKNAFSLSAEQAMAFAEEGSPAFFAGAFDVVQSTYFEPGKALAGTSIRSACSRAQSASSGRAITLTSLRTGFPRLRAWKRNSKPVPRWLTSDVATALPRS